MNSKRAVKSIAKSPSAKKVQNAEIQPIREKVEKKFTPNTITNFYNDRFTTVEMENKAQIVFKNMTEKEIEKEKSKKESTSKGREKIVIDISSYEPLINFKEIFEEKFEEFNTTLTEDKIIENIIENDINDFTVQSILSQCNKLDIESSSRSKRNKEIYHNFLTKKVIPQLWNKSMKNYTIIDYFKIIHSMFDYTDEKTLNKLKIKIFNTVFPLGVREGKERKGVNIIYLQRINKYHDLILKEMIKNKKDFPAILKVIQNDYINNMETKDKLTKKQLEIMKCNEIIEEIMTKNSKYDKKATEDLTKGFVADKIGSTKLTKDDVECSKKIADMMKELYSAKAFMVSVKNGEESSKDIVFPSTYKHYEAMVMKMIEDNEDEETIMKVVQDEYIKEFTKENRLTQEQREFMESEDILIKIIEENSKFDKTAIERWTKKLMAGEQKLTEEEIEFSKKIAEMMKVMYALNTFVTSTRNITNVNLDVAYEQYNEIFEKIKEFYDEIQSIEETYADFFVYFMKAAKFLKDVLKQDQAFKVLLKELKDQTGFRLNKIITKELSNLMNKEIDEEVIKDIIGDKTMEDFQPSKTYSIDDTEIYSQLGRYCSNELSKKYRIGVGVIMFKFINDELEKIMVQHGKKKSINVFIKV